MAILIDPPVWPAAHGGLWSHLVSDTNYAELHNFAKLLGVPRRGFDLDHYDVPESLYKKALELGAKPVAARELLFALHLANLRVKQAEKARVKPVRRLEFLREQWQILGETLDLPQNITAKNFIAEWQLLGNDLIARWREPHRHYHNLHHLEDVLLALNQFETAGAVVSTETQLAAWFHDAIYNGVTGEDETASAELARTALQKLGFNASASSDIAEMILATAPTATADTALSAKSIELPLAQLLDADLWVFASLPDRYALYTAGVRAEYAHIAEQDFRAGRAQILTTYLQKPQLYKTEHALHGWEEYARANVTKEIKILATQKQA